MSFQCREPTDCELEEELGKLTGKTIVCTTGHTDNSSSADVNVDNVELTEEDLKDPYLLEELSRLTLTHNVDDRGDSQDAIASSYDPQHGSMEQPQVDVINSLVEDRITRVAGIGKKSKHSIAQLKALVTRLNGQSKACQQAYMYYERTSNTKDSSLFRARKMAADQEIKMLMAEYKEKKEIPEYKSVQITYDTQEYDADIPENDMLVNIDCSSINKRSDYQLRISSELIPEKIVQLTDDKDRCAVRYEKLITRDAKQQKFFEYRRIKFELLRKEKSFLIFTNLHSVASSYIKLSQLSTKCSLQNTIKLLKYNFSVSVHLRYPMSKREPIKQEQEFIYIPSYPYYRSCIYCNDQDQLIEDDLLTSYVVLEKEMERCIQAKDEMNLLKLEALRDRLQIAVETGQLSMPDYLEQVKACIVKVKSRCLMYKKQGNAEMAKLLLVYMRAMEEEVKEAEVADTDV